MKTIKQLLNWLFGPRCRACNCRGALRRRMSTAYNKDELNWTTECDNCFEHTEEYWKERWEDHWRSAF